MTDWRLFFNSNVPPIPETSSIDFIYFVVVAVVVTVEQRRLLWINTAISWETRPSKCVIAFVVVSPNGIGEKKNIMEAFIVLYKCCCFFGMLVSERERKCVLLTLLIYMFSSTKLKAKKGKNMDGTFVCVYVCV